MDTGQNIDGIRIRKPHHNFITGGGKIDHKWFIATGALRFANNLKF